MSDALALTPDLIQRRDDLRALLGSTYGPLVALARKLLRRMAEQCDIPLMEAAQRLARDMDEQGVDTGLLIAALVEECEAGE
jgi:hypothetical protein